MNILQINSSARTQGALSTRLASRISAGLMTANDSARLVVRDLALSPHPELDSFALGALFTLAGQRSAEQVARVALDDALIAELQAADAVVLGVPMYNFGVPAALKNWIDAVSRARVTFRYTDNGPEGLLTGKKIYVALTRGGVYRNTPADTQAPFLRQVLGFLGMSDLEFIYAEGLAMGPEHEQKALGDAEQAIERALAQRAA